MYIKYFFSRKIILIPHVKPNQKNLERIVFITIISRQQKTMSNLELESNITEKMIMNIHI